MPERKGERRFDSVEVQGKGSYITVRSVTVGEIISAQEETESKRNVWFVIGRFLSRILNFFLPGRERGLPMSQATRNYAYLMIRKVLAWNWVDGEGNPFPQPREDPRVVERLTGDELQFIRNCAYGFRESELQKN